MVEWSKLAPDLKMCVTIHNENVAGRKVWMSRLKELLKEDCTKLELSKAEDKLNDLGIIRGDYEKVDGKWTYCYRIDSDAKSFIKNVAENSRRAV
jgi:hypothetical protein